MRKNLIDMLKNDGYIVDDLGNILDYNENIWIRVNSYRDGLILTFSIDPATESFPSVQSAFEYIQYRNSFDT